MRRPRARAREGVVEFGRGRGYRRLLDTLANVVLRPGGRPWLPELAAPPLAGPQTGGEKTALPSAKVLIPGGDQLPELIALHTNLAGQVDGDRRVAVEVLLTEAVLRGLVAEIVSRLTAAAGTPVADIAAGIAAVEAAGWTPTTTVCPTSSLVDEDAQRLAAVGLDVIGVATGGPTILRCCVSIKYWGGL
jgi:hypothetical protein